VDWRTITVTRIFCPHSSLSTAPVAKPLQRTPKQAANTNSDPFVVIVLALSFIASIFFLHIAAKIVRAFTAA